MNISKLLTRVCLVFPLQRISILTNILQPTHWSTGSNSMMWTSRGRGKKYISSFDSGHASCVAPMHAKSNFQILNSIPGIMVQLIMNIPLMNGIVPEHLDMFQFWHFHTHLSLLFIVATLTSIIRHRKGLVIHKRITLAHPACLCFFAITCSNFRLPFYFCYLKLHILFGRQKNLVID